MRMFPIDNSLFRLLGFAVIAWLGVIALVFFMTSLAFAQAASPSTTVSLDWLVNLAFEMLVPALVTAVSAVFGWLGARLAKLAGVNIDRVRQVALQDAIGRALQGAAERLRRAIDPVEVDVRSVLVAEAARYIERTMPDTLKHFNIDSDLLTDLVDQRLNLMLEVSATKPKPDGVGFVAQTGPT